MSELITDTLKRDLNRAIAQKIAYRKKFEQLEAENAKLKEARDKPLPPRPPLMRIGDRGELWDPLTNTRVKPEAPPTTEQRTLVKQACRTRIFVLGAFAGAVACLIVTNLKGFFG